MKKLYDFIKGFIIGAFMLLPGVSGGTTAILLGNYDELIDSVSNFHKNIKKNSILLLFTALGGVTGVLLMAKLLESIVKKLHYPMYFLFVGIILGGIPLLIRKANIKKIKTFDILYVIVGVAAVICISYIPKNIFNVEFSFTLKSIIFILLTGIIIAVALVLPGISVMLMLYVLGIYDRAITAINEFDISFLLPLLIAIIIGVLLTTKILDYFMKKFPRQIYLLILGFLLGSLKELITGFPSGWDIPLSILFFFFGFMAIFITSSNLIGDSN